MYPLESRDRAAQRHPDFLGQVVRFVSERQVLAAIQELANQVDPGQLLPAFWSYDEL
jgi:hypothetical protein